MHKKKDFDEILRILGILAAVFIIIRLLAPFLVYLIPVIIIVTLLFIFGVIPPITPGVRLDLKEVGGFHRMREFSALSSESLAAENSSTALDEIEEFPSGLKELSREPVPEIQADETPKLPCSMPQLKSGKTPHIQNQPDTVYFLSRHERLDNPYFREKN
ncbi:MAG: hypothetical protein IKD04_01960 [Clostridia bacterium]|nr:hypothetical protein [Clostridia bacterium]